MDITVVIPFRNEGQEVFRTVENLLAFSPSLPIIVINDGSDDGIDYSALGETPSLRYLVNPHPLGVAGSRDYGVKLAESDGILLMDAHMRLEENIFPALCAILEREEKALYCLQTKNMVDVDGERVIDVAPSPCKGARIKFDGIADGEECTGVEWVPLDGTEGDEVEVQCVLGAAYLIRKSYYLALHGLNGLAGYGMDEQLLSAKVWMSGGRCVLLKNLWAVHLYKHSTTSTYGRVLCSQLSQLVFVHLIFPYCYIEVYMEAARKRIDPYVFVVFERIEKEIEREREYLRRLFVKDFQFFIRLGSPSQIGEIQNLTHLLNNIDMSKLNPATSGCHLVGAAGAGAKTPMNNGNGKRTGKA